jgi:hypothetical protein
LHRSAKLRSSNLYRYWCSAVTNVPCFAQVLTPHSVLRIFTTFIFARSLFAALIVRYVVTLRYATLLFIVRSLTYSLRSYCSLAPLCTPFAMLTAHIHCVHICSLTISLRSMFAHYITPLVPRCAYFVLARRCAPISTLAALVPVTMFARSLCPVSIRCAHKTVHVRSLQYLLRSCHYVPSLRALCACSLLRRYVVSLRSLYYLFHARALT